MDRKIVKPAQPSGRIYNPEHGSFLPADGIEVAMAPYWIALERRGDIVTSDPALEPTPASTSSMETLAATASPPAA